MRSLWKMWCVVGLGALFAAPAMAQVHKVAAAAVPLEAGLEGEATLATLALESALGGDARAIPVSLLDHARGGPDDRVAKGAQAAKLLPEATDAMDGMEFAAAVTRARQATALFEAADLRESMGGLLEAMALESLALLAQGKKVDAKNVMNRLFTLKPDYKFNASRLTPDASKASEEVRAKLRGRARGVLEVKASAPALVYVDGIFKGQSPVTVTDLIAGSHYVTAFSLGQALVQEKGFAGPGGSLTISFSALAKGAELLAQLNGVRDGFAGGAPADAAASLARWAQADEVLVLGLNGSSTRPTALAARVDRQGHLIAKTQKTLAGRGEAARGDLASIVRELLAAELPKAAEPIAVALPPPPTVTETSRGSRSAKVIAGWSLLGASVACGAGGLGLGLNVKSLAQQARNTPQTDTADYNQLVSTGKTRGYAADALYGVAAASAVTGAVLLILGSTGSSDVPTASLAPIDGGAALAVQGRF